MTETQQAPALTPQRAAAEAAAKANAQRPKQAIADKAPAIAKPVGVPMWSPTGDCHIGLTSGHTFVVPGDREGAVVPKAFRKEALARGCLPVGMEVEDIEPGSEFDRATVIRTEMEKMLNSDDDGAFTSDGKPSLKVLAKACGFTIAQVERDRLWQEVQAGLDE